MPTVALMWEAKAAPGQGPALLEWARTRPLPASPSSPAPSPSPSSPAPSPLRREHFTAPGDRVLVITWWEGGYDADVPELPEPDGELIARPVHRWRFEQV